MEPDPLAGRVARFRELQGNDALLVDTAIPRFARTIWSIIGRNVGEDRAEQPPIPAEGFHLADRGAARKRHRASRPHDRRGVHGAHGAVARAVRA